MEGALGQVPEDVRRTLRSYLADVTKVFGPEVEAVILYGSAARGDYLPGRSNVNLLILLKRQDGALLREYA
jgi:predicted nucleotidyltransferase